MTRSSNVLGMIAPILVIVAALLFLAGCGPGDGQGLDENGNLLGQSSAGGGGGGGGAAAGASGNPNATLAWVQGNVFGGVCSQCHIGAGAPFGVNWSSETNTCANIGRTSGEMPTLSEIERSDPAASYMIWKVQGAGPNGESIAAGTARMPLNNPALPPETIQNMRDWIADGAPGC
jgi:hypothetical protein